MHECCYHRFTGPLLRIVPDGHVVQKCCKCDNTRTVHRDHLHEERRLSRWAYHKQTYP